MYVETIPNRSSPPAVLLRETWREDGKVKKRTLANLTHWPAQLVEHFRVLLRGGVAVESASQLMTIERSLPHGHVAAVLGTLRACGRAWFTQAPARLRPIVEAMIVMRVVTPASKLATWRMLEQPRAVTSLPMLLDLDSLSPDDLYAALDWLGQAQPDIERRLAKQHLSEGVLVLYDLTSTWLTGQCCELAAPGYSRDGKKGEPQIVFGLICTRDGCPVAVEVFPGNTADCATVAAQVEKLKTRFGLSRVVWVGDRGMLTETKIETVLRPAGMSWVTALRASQIRQLAEAQGPWQLSLFDETGLLEVASPEYPGERLMVCRNPALAEERARTRQALLAATERELDKIVAATQRQRSPLQGESAIGVRVGKVIERFKMAKHFALTITENSFSYARKIPQIEAEAALDGLYVLRTDVPQTELSAAQVVGTYKSLAHVERAFRALKTVDLHVRPIFHWNSDRVRAHVFLCLLAYYVEWQMRQKLKPLLFDDEEIPPSPSPARPAERSESARQKDATGLNPNGMPVHSFRSLLADLATVCYNVASTPLNPNAKIILTTRPTALQREAFQLLGITPDRTQ
ncbi:MAG TPA: IS1634 family transposase [Methylococcaceae bacterium]|jgi:hypothetical protein|nr:IS1634 family transposase [Methylococcaceae bacterium]